jgi:uncharacterized membrane protein (DUF373 family)
VPYWFSAFGKEINMLDYLKKFERLIVHALIGMMMLVVFLATLDLAWLIIYDIITAPIALLSVKELNEIFGFFLLVLIGIELLETIKAYLIEGVVHVEIVIEVALIAVARKVITLNLKDYEGLTIIGVAALILSISAAVFCIKRVIKKKA